MVSNRPSLETCAGYFAANPANAHKAGRHTGHWHIDKLHNLEVLLSTGFMVSCFPVRIERVSAGWIRAVAIIDG